MSVGLLFTRKVDRKQGYSDILFEEVVRRNPKVRAIKSDLSGENRRILEDGLNKGLTVMQALANTPAYKTRMRLGFAQISFIPPEHSENGFYVIIGRKPANPNSQPPTK